MKGSRLPWLLTVLAGLALLRWWMPPQSDADGEIARPTRSVPRDAPTVTRGSEPAAPTTPAAVASAVSGDDEIPNAFAVRLPPPPPPPAPEAKSPSRKRVVAPPPPPPPPPAPPPAPRIQVIGTWDDPQAPGVFVALPSGTTLARVGTVLQSEYKVTEVGRNHLALMHVTSQHVWRIAVPRGAARP